MNMWLITATVSCVLLGLWLLIRTIRSADKDKLKQAKNLNKEMDKDIDALTHALHKQEKREADHEKRVADFIWNHDLDVDRINFLLNNYPPETEAASAIKSKDISP